VGPLQFEVLKYRLESEYGAECRMESSSWVIARWICPDERTGSLSDLIRPSGSALARDTYGFDVILFDRATSLRFFQEKNPDCKISARPLMPDPEAGSNG